MSIKKIILFAVILSSYILTAQKNKIEHLSNFDKLPLRWGFYIGANMMDYHIAYKKPTQFPDAYVETEPHLGFNLGLIGDMRLHNNINLRLEPGLLTNSKTLYFRHLPNEIDSVRKVSGTYLHVPLLMQFSTNRMLNVRPYFAVGLAYDYNFASNFHNPDDNAGGEFRMQKHNFMYEIGLGMDFYFYYFKFSPSIRGIFAINNELKYDDDPDSPWTAPVDFFGTRGVFLRLTFQ
jgi:hypothetical protein